MKKSLVALAALAATASFAQSTVTITGIMDAGYFASKQVGDQTANYIGQSGARTTTFKFIGSEDLGGGNAATFQFEVQPSIIAGDGNLSGLAKNTNAANGQAASSTTTVANPSGLVGKGMSYVGLKSNTLGEVRAGTINGQSFGAFAATSQLGTGVGSGYENVVPNITRFESAVAYDTPVFNGFSGGFVKGYGNDYSYGSSTTTYKARDSVMDWGITYANGPLAVKYTTLTAKAALADTTTTKLFGGAYDAGIAKVSLATGSRKTASSSVDANISLAAVSVPFMGTYRFIYQQSAVKYNVGAPSGTAGEKSKVSGWALEKDLSKRTFVYLRAQSMDLAAASASGVIVNGGTAISTSTWGNTTSKSNLTAIGVSHSF